MKNTFIVELSKLWLSLIKFASIAFKKRSSEILNATLLTFLRYILLKYGNRRFTHLVKQCIENKYIKGLIYVCAKITLFFNQYVLFYIEMDIRLDKILKPINKDFSAPK